MKTIKEFMNKDVIFLSPDNTIFEAAKLLAQLDIAGAPVVKKDKIIGILSISDIIKFIDIKLGKLPKIDTPGLSNVLLALFKMKKIHSEFKKELDEEYAKLRELILSGGKKSEHLTLEEARAKKCAIEWRQEDLVEPSFLGVKDFCDFDLNEIRERIDWGPLFWVWDLKGKYPDILNHPQKGGEAQKILH